LKPRWASEGAEVVVAAAAAAEGAVAVAEAACHDPRAGPVAVVAARHDPDRKRGPKGGHKVAHRA
jgi:hypothetical protein